MGIIRTSSIFVPRNGIFEVENNRRHEDGRLHDETDTDKHRTHNNNLKPLLWMVGEDDEGEDDDDVDKGVISLFALILI